MKAKASAFAIESHMSGFLWRLWEDDRISIRATSYRARSYYLNRSIG
jgi:hypothetical protein